MDYRKLTVALILLFTFLSAASPAQERLREVSGRVVDHEGNPVAFATVVLEGSDSTKKTGTTTGEQGRFSLKAAAGTYKLQISYVGYVGHQAGFELKRDVDLGDIKLENQSTEIEAVAVTTQLITREADRFVVNVAGSKSAIGKNALEMLALSPGVWVTKDNISINGKQGTRVMVDERMLNMSGEDLAVYLRGINAEDILKIEVIPVSGADYEADSSGGIVKITLRRQRRDGIEGTIGLWTAVWREGYEFGPSANLNYRRGKTSLYTYLASGCDRYYSKADERTDFMPSGNVATSVTELYNDSRPVNVKLGAIYDLSPKHNIGIEANYNRYSNPGETSSTAILTTPLSHVTDNVSRYGVDHNTNMFNLTANYFLKLDTLGSQLKIIADYFTHHTTRYNRYFNQSRYDGGSPLDTLYSSDADSPYRIYALTVNIEKRLSAKTMLKTGGKYSYNDMGDDLLYRGLDHNGEWITNNDLSSSNSYSEQVGALYAILNSRLGKLSYSLGLRGEYTYARPRFGSGGANPDHYSKANQSYFDLFPNVNLSMPLNKKQSVMLIGAYARKIQRPPFWALNPFRVTLSEYSYVEGNPDLNPAYSDDISLTTVLGYRYTLTAGVKLEQGHISQVSLTDPSNPNILIYRNVNIPHQHIVYINANAPVEVNKYLTINANATLMNMGNDYGGENRRQNTLQANATATVSLPANFSFELQCYAMTKAVSGNMEVEPSFTLNAGIKKRFAKDRLTMSAWLFNITESAGYLRITMNDPSFSKRITMREKWLKGGFALRYNFRSGVEFKARKVESGSQDDASRLGSGSK